jgi:hypothetical protein
MTTQELIELKTKAEIEIEGILNQLSKDSGAELTVNVSREYNSSYEASYPVKIKATL